MVRKVKVSVADASEGSKLADFIDFKEEISGIISNLLDYPLEKVRRLIKEPNKNISSDWAINCFGFKPLFKENGDKIAQKLKQRIEDEVLPKYSFISSVDVMGPYLNFNIDKKIKAISTFSSIITDVRGFSKKLLDKSNNPKKRIVIEYPSPNTNKPLHLGHVRNLLLGQMLSKLRKYGGDSVFEVNLLNDRGVHICKSMWAYMKYGNNSTPESEGIKSDHFVGKYYVKYAQEEANLKKEIEQELKELEIELKKKKSEQDQEKIKELKERIERSPYTQLQNTIKDMLVKWEKGDEAIRKIWRLMNDWAEDGFRSTFKIFGIEHDKWYYESNIYDKGKEIVLEGLKKGLFEQLEDGAIICRFKKKGLPKEKVLLRKDGTTLYITQDLYLAHQKMEDFQYDLSIYVIGNEQNMQLKTLFEILNKINFKGENLHYSYGMINLTTGKMKSREGTVVDADDLVKELIDLSTEEVKNRYKDLTELEIEYRSNIIALAALRFFIIKYEYSKDFLFDPKESISFEGETGPYILYSYARLCSIFRKAKSRGFKVPYDPDTEKNYPDFIKKIDFSNYSVDEEISLIDTLYQYPSIIYESVNSFKPHILARYLLKLAQEFNAFYHSCQILKEADEIRDSRMLLCENVRQILKNGLNLLSIKILKEM